jgi:hypothetical protein
VDVCGVYCLAIYLLKCHGMRNRSSMLFNFVLEHCSGGVADNNITSLCRLDALTNLNTLVLSHNPICKLGKSVAKLVSLTKVCEQLS